MPTLLRSCLLALTVLLCRAAQAQTPTWQAAAGAGNEQGTGAQAQVYATVADASGHAYLAGMFSGTVRFGTTVVSSAGSTDAFVAKWNSLTNTYDWVLPLGGPGTDRGTALALSGTTLYLTGSFTGTTSLGGLPLTSAGQEDGFVAKITDAGSSAAVTWARAVGGPTFDGLTGVAVSGSSVYVAGSFTGTAQLGALSLTATGSNDVLVAKLADAGSAASVAWARRAGGTGPDFAQAIAANGANVYVAGYYSSGAAEFGGTPLANSSLSTLDSFVTKLTDSGTAGTFAWTQSVNGPGDDLLRTLAVQGSNVYVAGNYNSATLGAGALTLGSHGGFDLLVAKLVDAGSTASFAWAYNAGGSGGDTGSGLVAVGSYLFLTGGFTSPTIAFGPTTLTNTSTTSDAYVAQLTDAGSSASFAYALGAGGAGDDYGIGIGVGGARVYVGGSAGSAARFGAYTLPASASGAPAGFVATLTDATVLGTAAASLVQEVAVFPNPARHRATVQLPAVPGVAATVVLTDALGRTCWAHPATVLAARTTLTVPLDHLARGIYYLHVRAGAHSITRALGVE
ncbi:T9SS type A sorting domain-containing protein [Hymenobacter sp. 15J16-1T3B]|uniref:T9SS type A sorting domain-containing protein n=1 Tax=Hymenobacter sp. 15J16-1T3B TaxID=2886941 RepID=UPI001D12670F|nr:T9SS type A sorting domain-containing protein [Hymenobacter sp. 15J16-1T3B]MCC3160832.1 T9SS type A sorting domain-containing protein [Hymenobacter sp. 15J16-1T3B]